MVDCLPQPTTALCRGLEYLLKIQYFILDSPNVAKFLWAGRQHCPMFENNVIK